MKLTLKRTIFTETSTIGELYADNMFLCNTLEDVDRGLTSDLPLTDILKVKIKHETAIPYGTYKLVISFSPRFKTYLPLLLNVPGYMGIRIHAGNTSADSSGCILVGTYSPKKKNFISYSRVALNKVLSILNKIIKKEEIIIEIIK